MLMDICLPTFNIYQDTVVPSCFKSRTISWCHDFFQKKALYHVQSEIHLVRVTSFLVAYLTGLKKTIFRPAIIKPDALSNKQHQVINPQQGFKVTKKYHFQKQPPEKNFATFTRLESFFSKVVDRRSFSVNFMKFLKTPSLQKTSGRLLLTISENKWTNKWINK